MNDGIRVHIVILTVAFEGGGEPGAGASSLGAGLVPLTDGAPFPFGVLGCGGFGPPSLAPVQLFSIPSIWAECHLS